MEFVRWQRHQENKLIAEIVMQREDVMNAFNSAMAEQFITACEEIKQSGVYVVGVRSSSPKAFCTGADLKERDGMTDDQWRNQHRLFENMFYTLADLPMPTIAVIDGYALAGGLELALNCDLWVVSTRTIIGLPEVTRGIMPGGGGTRLLAKRIGVHRAKQIILTGGRFGVESIKEWGLSNAVVSPDDLDSAFLALAKPIASNAPLAVRYCKAAIDELFGMSDQIARTREITWYDKCVDTEDRLEGVRAFNEKRPPVFSGR